MDEERNKVIEINFQEAAVMLVMALVRCRVLRHDEWTIYLHDTFYSYECKAFSPECGSVI